MGQNMANLEGQPWKKKDEAQGTKGKISTTSSTKHQKGRKYMCVYIYMSNIYKEEKYMDINQGVMYLTLGVIPTFLET